MHTFTLPDISCNHCAKAITNAIHEIDANAIVAVDVAAKTVTVESTLTRESIAAALVAEGYPEKP